MSCNEHMATVKTYRDKLHGVTPYPPALLAGLHVARLADRVGAFQGADITKITVSSLADPHWQRSCEIIVGPNNCQQSRTNFSELLGDSAAKLVIIKGHSLETASGQIRRQRAGELIAVKQ